MDSEDSNLNIYTPCSALINECDRCTSKETRIKCVDGYETGENGECISVDEINQQNYYKDEETQKYIKCDIIDYCVKCSSGEKCLECQEGYNVINDTFQKSQNNQDEQSSSDKLSRGAIAGIVLGCVAFLSLASFLVYFFVNKFKGIGNAKPDNNIAKTENGEKLDEGEEKVEENTSIYEKSMKKLRKN